MTQAIQKLDTSGWGPALTEEQFDDVIQTGSIGKLTMDQRSSFLWHYAKRYNLDPLTKPFDLIPGNDGKLIIYANRTASDQLRKMHKLSDEITYQGPLQIGEDIRKDVYVVRVRVSDSDSRHGEAIGSVSIDDLMGEALSNAIMKCHTKALRRATLAFAGLGISDETEVSSIGASVAPQKSITSGPKILDATPLAPATPPAKV